MKELAVYIIVIVSSMQSIIAETNTCPPYEEGQEDPPVDILLPHESDCTKFYKCSHGVAVVQDCPAYLQFNPSANYCDWAANVNCTNSSDGNNNDVCIGENANEILQPHETNCEQFYIIKEDHKLLENCIPGLKFNREKSCCDWPENVNCSNSESSQNTGEINNEKIETDVNGENEHDTCPSENPEVDVLFPHESNCSQFYKCDKGEKVLQDCPSGLYFNPNVNYCDWPENVNCTNVENYNEKIEADVDGVTENDTCPSENPEVDVLFPHESNCSQFYKCDKGEKVLQDCPSGLYFNPNVNYCDWPENVNCTNGENYNENIEADVDGETKNDTCPLENPEVDVLFPHESNCSQFYKCDKGEKVLQDCPSGLYFNPTVNYCDWSENVDCQNVAT